VTLVYLDENEKKRTAKVLLQKEDYHLATEAHNRGEIAKITGKLAGKKSKTIEYSKFEVFFEMGK
jgi:hypothetical protein